MTVCSAPCSSVNRFALYYVFQETAPGNGISPQQWRTQAHSASARTVTAAQAQPGGSDSVDLFARRWLDVALPRLQVEMREVRALWLFLAGKGKTKCCMSALLALRYAASLTPSARCAGGWLPVPRLLVLSQHWT